jgi:hypothetical protein
MEYQEFIVYGDHSSAEIALYDYSLDHPDSYKDVNPTEELHGYFPAFVGFDLA